MILPCSYVAKLQRGRINLFSSYIYYSSVIVIIMLEFNIYPPSWAQTMGSRWYHFSPWISSFIYIHRQNKFCQKHSHSGFIGQIQLCIYCLHALYRVE